MANKTRKILTTAAVVLAAMAYVGYDLSGFVAGREHPGDDVIANAVANTLSANPAPPIESYESFSVPVEDGISVSVYAREADTATANIFMMHGAGGGAWAWEEYFEHFPDQYNLYAASWRGHFTSTPIDDANAADYTRDEVAAIRAVAERNDLPIHVLGHSFGGAVTALSAAQLLDEVASVHFIAPIVPVDMTFLQGQILPVIMPRLAGSVFPQTFNGMFVDTAQRDRYWELYQSKPYSTEYPGLFRNGTQPAWQKEIENAYLKIGEAGLPAWFLIARYDNSIAPGDQQSIAQKMGAEVTIFPVGHYIMLEPVAEETVQLIVEHLEAVQ